MGALELIAGHAAIAHHNLIVGFWPLELAGLYLVSRLIGKLLVRILGGK